MERTLKLVLAVISVTFFGFFLSVGFLLNACKKSAVEFYLDDTLSLFKSLSDLNENKSHVRVFNILGSSGFLERKFIPSQRVSFANDVERKLIDKLKTEKKGVEVEHIGNYFYGILFVNDIRSCSRCHRNSDGIYGYITVKVRENHLLKNFNIFKFVSIFLLFLLISGGVLFYLLDRWFIAPFKEIVDSVWKISLGDLEEPVYDKIECEDVPCDEIDRLKLAVERIRRSLKILMKVKG